MNRLIFGKTKGYVVQLAWRAERKSDGFQWGNAVGVDVTTFKKKIKTRKAYKALMKDMYEVMRKAEE